jgi:CubicO group peptidase (beta-lactamase class C family)
VSRAYGLADLERDVPVAPDTIFDAASVTKQFVAAAILLLVEEGRLSLSEDIRRYVPELPDAGHKITLDHLMTHTSGIRDWTAILPLVAGDPDALTVVLRQRGLNFAPGEELSYSNSGYVLLKEIVARTSGVSFSEFTLKRLFEPLGMKSTQYLVDLREIVKKRALAYEKVQGHWKLEMKLDNNRGGGGALLSTPSDLLIWNEALTSGRLGAFVTEKLHEPARLNNGRKLGYGRGLCLDSYRGAKEVWHSGGSAGYSTWLGRYPEHGLSIAIMCNAGDSSESSRLAHRIFDLFVPDAGAPDPEDGPPPAISDDALPDVNTKTGLFVSERTGDLLRLALDRGRFRVAGGPGLVAVTKDRFRRWGASVQFMSQDEFELHFLSPDQFELKSMEGTTTRYRRAQPHAPTPDDLKALRGRYESDEIGAVFRIEPKGDGLAICLEHSPQQRLEFKPVDRDTFQLSRVTMRFLRDETGKVVALDYSNPVLRSVNFTRLSDRS